MPISIKDSGMRVALAVACVGAGCLACAAPPRWIIQDEPTDRDMALMLDGGSRIGRVEVTAEEIPGIPPPTNLRPCCAFGSEIGARLGPIPLPGFSIPNVIGPDDLGPHVYDAGLIEETGSGETDVAFDIENNGLLYTCRGGFVDTAHVRGWMDWTLYLSAELGRLLLDERDGVLPLPEEGAARRIVLTSPDREIFERYGHRRVTIWAAQWMAWKMSLWHEIATWYGFQSVHGYSERASAFSPEDLFSNGLGIRLSGPIIMRRGTRSEFVWNESVDAWLAKAIHYAGAVERSVAVDAAHAVEGLWWDASARLPDAHIVMRRMISAELPVDPWLVPADRMSDSLREACGDEPQPLPIPGTPVFEDLDLRDVVTLELEPGEDLRAREPFASLPAKITDSDFPAIVEDVRRQNAEEFGEGSDRPE